MTETTKHAETTKAPPDTPETSVLVVVEVRERWAVVLPPKTTSDYVALFAAGEIDAAQSLARDYAREHWPDGDSMKIDVEPGDVFLSPEAEAEELAWRGAMAEARKRRTDPHAETETPDTGPGDRRAGTPTEEDPR